VQANRPRLQDFVQEIQQSKCCQKLNVGYQTQVGGVLDVNTGCTHITFKHNVPAAAESSGYEAADPHKMLQQFQQLVDSEDKQFSKDALDKDAAGDISSRVLERTDASKVVFRMFLKTDTTLVLSLFCGEQ